MTPRQRKQNIGTRLSTLTLLLYARGKATGEELAEKVGVNLRTVYRDVTRLQELGIPIISMTGSKGGFAFDYQAIGSAGFTTERGLWNLLTATGSADALLPGDVTSDLGQAGEASLDEDDYRALLDTRNRIFVDHREWYTAEREAPRFEEIRQAVFGCRRLRLIYTERAEAKLAQTILEPYGLIWKGGVWYVFGAVPPGGQFMRTRLQRIVELEETGTTFVRKEGFDLRAAWDDELEAFGSGSTKVVMRIGMAAIHEFEDFNFKQDNKIEKRDDCWIVEMMVDRYAWLVPLVLSYGGDVAILEPEELRATIAQAGARLAETHSLGRPPAEGDTSAPAGDIRPRAMTRHELGRP